MSTEATAPPLRLAILISGNGSNLQAIIDQIAAGKLNARIDIVISDQPGAYGLERAARAGIATSVVKAVSGQQRNQYDRRLIEILDPLRPELLVLAGFMRILSPRFVQHYAGRIINIHPSLLPAYKGLNTHQRVLDAGDRYHGATVHFVTEELDAGEIILQSRIQIRPGETAKELQQRIHAEEHVIYPRAIAWLEQRRHGTEPD